MYSALREHAKQLLLAGSWDNEFTPSRGVRCKYLAGGSFSLLRRAKLKSSQAGKLIPTRFLTD
jgi:hypothetical protein